MIDNVEVCEFNADPNKAIIGLEKIGSEDYIFVDSIQRPQDQSVAMRKELLRLAAVEYESHRNYLKGKVISSKAELRNVIAQKLKLPNSYKILVNAANWEKAHPNDDDSNTKYQDHLKTSKMKYKITIMEAWVKKEASNAGVKKPKLTLRPTEAGYQSNHDEWEKYKMFNTRYKDFIEREEGLLYQENEFAKLFEDSPDRLRFFTEVYFFLTNIAFISYSVYSLFTSPDSEWDYGDHLSVSKYLSRTFEGD